MSNMFDIIKVEQRANILTKTLQFKNIDIQYNTIKRRIDIKKYQSFN